MGFVIVIETDGPVGGNSQANIGAILLEWCGSSKIKKPSSPRDDFRINYPLLEDLLKAGMYKYIQRQYLLFVIVA
jgi:hypothetical protein